MDFYQQLQEVTGRLQYTGRELSENLARILSDSYNPPSGGEGPWAREWADPRVQAQWDLVRQAWHTFTVQVMGVVAGVPIAPTAIQVAIAETDAEVGRIARQIRDRAIQAEMAALGIVLPGEETKGHGE